MYDPSKNGKQIETLTEQDKCGQFSILCLDKQQKDLPFYQCSLRKTEMCLNELAGRQKKEIFSEIYSCSMLISEYYILPKFHEMGHFALKRFITVSYSSCVSSIYIQPLFHFLSITRTMFHTNHEIGFLFKQLL